MTTQEIKRQAKEAFHANYWPCVLMGFLFTIGYGGVSISFGGSNSTKDIALAYQQLQEVPESERIAIIIGASAMIFFLMLMSLVISIAVYAFRLFAIMPLSIGCSRFFLDNSDGEGSLDVLTCCYTRNYINTVKCLFARDWRIYLWSLLCIIPGIIKSYDYAMVHYIVAEHPDIDPKEALHASEQMMYGYRFSYFLFTLSFILWLMSALVTCGISLIFYVKPYMAQACAIWYQQRRDKFYVSECVSHLRGQD